MQAFMLRSMKKKIILSILLFVIGVIILYINPGKSLNQFICFALSGISASTLAYKKQKNAGTFTQQLFKDKISGVLSIIVSALGILGLVSIYIINNTILTDITFAGFILSLIALIIRAQIYKRTNNDKFIHNT